MPWFSCDGFTYKQANSPWFEAFLVRLLEERDRIGLTDMIREAVGAEGLRAGFVHVFLPHTTAGLTVNERIDPQVVSDLMAHLDRMVPWNGAWTHPVNAAAHIKGALLGHSLVLGVEEGNLQIGGWQGVFLCEFNGPRPRRVWLTFQPEAGGSGV